MLTALLAVRNLMGERHDLWEVNTERSYHEDFEADARPARVPGRSGGAGPGAPVVGRSRGDPMRVTMIIPARDAATTLPRCLSALAASTSPPSEVIVVDDGSTDATGDVAARAGARVLRLSDGPLGPAAARNRGAVAARGDVLVFLDADVAVHDDALALVRAGFEADDGLAALFGSYDADPPERGLVSRYKNLVHHYTHQHGRREASTFWAGCGAIRRDVFLESGGFDEAYRVPSIEDIELGFRLRRAGLSIRSCPEVQATHLKRWTLWSLIRTDVARRAIPWSRLIVRTGVLPDDLNVCRRARLSAAAAWLAVASLVVAWWVPPSAAVALPALLLLGFWNRGLLGFFRDRGGLGFAIGAGLLHTLYFLYSSLVFALVGLASPPSRRAGPCPAEGRAGSVRETGLPLAVGGAPPDLPVGPLPEAVSR
jgi:GT2 family glycosyltransferase